MTELLPVNLSVEDVHSAAGLSLAENDLPIVPTTDQLSNWTQEAYSLDVSAATTLGFPLGNVSASFKRQALMFGCSRWKDTAKNGYTYRFGVALRAIVVVSEMKGDGGITLPVIAAKVELEGARATAQLIVRGYKGEALATMLPAWQTFGVDSYAHYQQTVSAIQSKILGDPAGIQPELLGTTAGPGAPSPAVAFGTLYALRAIGQGSTLAHAIDELKTSSPEVVRAAKSVYASRLGDDDGRAVPTAEQRETARSDLEGYELTHGLFGH